jgi:hypothetical protein
MCAGQHGELPLAGGATQVRGHGVLSGASLQSCTQKPYPVNPWDNGRPLYNSHDVIFCFLNSFFHLIPSDFKPPLVLAC